MPGPRSTSGMLCPSAKPKVPEPRAAARAVSDAERDIEPAGLAAEGPDRAVLEQVLRVEMRALAVRRCDGVQHRELARSKELVHLREVRAQAEVAVEIERATGRARCRHGERTSPRRVLRSRRTEAPPRARPCRRAGT